MVIPETQIQLAMQDALYICLKLSESRTHTKHAESASPNDPLYILQKTDEEIFLFLRAIAYVPTHAKEDKQINRRFQKENKISFLYIYRVFNKAMYRVIINYI